jgi:RecA-family ATPase
MAGVTELRLQLRAAGFAPLPLNGKAPSSVNGWQSKLTVTTDEIRLWEKLYPYDTNTGALTKLVPAIDIDINNPNAAEAVEALAREHFEEHGHILVRIGRAPRRAVLLRTDEPFTKLKLDLVTPHDATEKIEILADGQQLVLFGTHPDTQHPYRWHGGEPGQIRREDLPYIRESDAQRFLDDAARLLIDEYGYRHPQERAKTNGADAGNAANGGSDWRTYLDNPIDHDKLTSFAMSLVRAGLNAGATVNLLRAVVQRLEGVDPERKQRRLHEIPGMVSSAEAKPAETKLPFVDMAQWDGEEVPIRQWSVPDRLPLRQPALFSGEGATGKTILELQLCTAHVLGRDWLDTLPNPGPAIYLGCEDEADELHRRLADIAKHYGVTFADLINGGLHLICLAGKDALLGIPDRSGQIIATPLFKQLLETAARIKPRHIGIDTSADVYGGSEIDRGQVRQFIGLLRALAITANGSVVLLGHPSLQGISSGSGLSGSTGWHNSVRARMYLRSPQNEHDEQPDSDLRELQFLKNNYGRLAQRVVLRYRNGVFVPEPSMSIIERAAREQAIDDAFLAVLGKLIASNRLVNPSPNASNYAPTVIASHPDGKAHSRKDYQAAMARLFDAGKIHIASDGPPSKKVRFLALGKGAKLRAFPVPSRWPTRSFVRSVRPIERDTEQVVGVPSIGRRARRRLETTAPAGRRQPATSRETMEDTHSALVLRNGPVLAPVWVQEDEYSYHLHINLANNGREHGIRLTVWKGVNSHHPPSVFLETGANAVEFTWVSKDDGNPITLDAFRQWVMAALDAEGDARGMVGKKGGGYR